MKRVSSIGLAVALIAGSAPAAVVSVFDPGSGRLTVASNAADAIAMTASAGLVKVNGADVGTGPLLSSNVRELLITGGPGSNSINLSGVLRAQFTQLALVGVEVSAGSDTVVGSDFDETIQAGDGHVVNAGGGADSISVVPGAGATVEGGAGADAILLNGTGGNDTLTLLAGTAPGAIAADFGGGGTTEITGVEAVTVNLSSGEDSLRIRDLSGVKGVATIIGNGGTGNDTMEAAQLPAGIVALVLNGNSENDSIQGSRGDDAIDGGSGDDIIAQGRGNDNVDGGTGEDTIRYTTAADGELVALRAGTGVLLETAVGTSDFAGIETAELTLGAPNGEALIDAFVPGDLQTALVIAGAAGTSAAIAGTDSADGFVISASATPGRLRVARSGQAPLAVETEAVEQVSVDAFGGEDNVSGGALTPPAGLAELVLRMGSGADDVDLSLIEPAAGFETLIDGGPDSDALIGSRGIDLVYGGTGDDTITGGRGADILRGGVESARGGSISGDDTFVWNNGDASDAAEGGDGADVQIVNGANDGGDSFLLDNSLAIPSRAVLQRTSLVPFSIDMEDIETLEVNGLGGTDHLAIENLQGAACPAAVRYFGGAGNDSAVASAVLNDGVLQSLLLDGGGDDDSLIGSRLADVLMGGQGNDELASGIGDDTFDGGGGDDSIFKGLGTGNCTVDGGPGNDLLQCIGLNSGNVADVFAVTTPAAGIVRVQLSGSGNYTAEGQNIEQVEIATLGGDDIVDASGATLAEAGLHIDGALGIDTIIGSPFADSILGGGDEDTITPGGGADTVDAGDGNDVLHWNDGDGADSITMGADFDRVVVTTANSAETLLVGDEPFSRGVFPLLVSRTSAPAFALTGSGVERIELNAGNGADDITMASFLGHDDISAVHIFAGGGDDTIDAGSLPAGVLDEVVLEGGAGNDFIIGTPGVDTIRGGADNDTLMGGRGVDIVEGDGGTDVIQWFEEDGNDRVDGGTGTGDRLELNATESAGGSFPITLSALKEATRIRRNPPARGGPSGFQIDFSGTEVLNLTGGSGTDSYDVQDLSGTANLNRVVFTAGGGLDDLTINGSIGSDTVLGETDRISMHGISFRFDASMESILADCHDGDDAVVASSAPATELVYLGGEGTDSFQFDADGMAFTQSGTDSIIFSQTGREDVSIVQFENVGVQAGVDVWTVQ